ncbi:MAG: hypothetical protein ACYCS8_10670, partial [Acidithiobacillus sp.]
MTGWTSLKRLYPNHNLLYLAFLIHSQIKRYNISGLDNPAPMAQGSPMDARLYTMPGIVKIS